jgi:hypothetical protein
MLSGLRNMQALIITNLTNSIKQNAAICKLFLINLWICYFFRDSEQNDVFIGPDELFFSSLSVKS